MDQAVTQSPANSDTQAPTGRLGVDADSNLGFDICSDLVNGKTVSATGFAAITPNVHGVGGPAFDVQVWRWEFS